MQLRSGLLLQAPNLKIVQVMKKSCWTLSIVAGIFIVIVQFSHANQEKKKKREIA